MRYGIPYKGSKNKIARWVVDNLPPADTLVDLFAGGCAVTHCAMLDGKYRHFIANDITDGVKIFNNAIHGKYRNETRWISREDFYKLKDSDEYVALCWSFGNNRKDYLYAKHLEPWKKALHYARVYGDCSLLREIGITGDGTKRDILAHKDEYKQKYITCFKREPKSRMELLQSLESLERLQSLERLERLQSLESLEIKNLDYRQVKIPKNATVYADPPYLGTRTTQYGIGGNFDYPAFEAWLATVPFPVFVSEYTCPKGCVQIAETLKQKQASGKGTNGYAHEGLFVQERFLQAYRDSMTEQLKWDI